MQPFCLKMIPSVLFVLAGFVLFQGGCSKTEVANSSQTFTSIYSNTLSSSSCQTCHKPGGSAWVDGIHTDFTSQGAAYRDLTTLTVQSGSNTTCSSVSIVKAGEPQKSYLLAILFDDYASSNFAGVTGCTPTAAHREYGATLSANEKSALINWISAGAAND